MTVIRATVVSADNKILLQIPLRGHIDSIHIYFNESENPSSDHPRLWSQDHYRRSKMTWNYYSP